MSNTRYAAACSGVGLTRCIRCTSYNTRLVRFIASGNRFHASVERRGRGAERVPRNSQKKKKKTALQPEKQRITSEPAMKD